MMEMTRRLILDRPVPGDVDAVFAIANDPRTWSHLPEARVTDPGQTAALLAMFHAGWKANGLAAWVLRPGSDEGLPGLAPGRLLGTGGVNLVQAGAESAVWNLGYRLDPACWGRGFATELATYAVDRARATGKDVPVIARVLSSNPSSTRVAQKAGLQLRWEGPAGVQGAAAAGEVAVTRLILADRELEPGVLQWLVSRG
ncbi:GNAT family N-acetyltransferase [Arthrobacter sp. AQ5-05]|uniref:GNAT family N-acetyltransferase n=1 Tax=Arthrobacter sp. AQ5-05 TaxID=2184581 RepID=UPI0015EB6BAA|nr:GNAT family N-acetyltransferase [Arthrobacter sp. AQ5-05]